MRRLYLLRHAKSDWSLPGQPDRDRPLSTRGRAAIAVIAEFLAGADPPPDLVLCSPARRARDTVAGVQEAQSAVVPVQYDESLYAAPASRLLQRARTLPSTARCVLICGHNPGLQELAVTLAGDGEHVAAVRAKLPTGGLVALDVDGDWSQLAPGVCVLASFVTPKRLATTADKTSGRHLRSDG